MLNVWKKAETQINFSSAFSFMFIKMHNIYTQIIGWKNSREEQKSRKKYFPSYTCTDNKTCECNLMTNQFKDPPEKGIKQKGHKERVWRE